MGTTSAQFGWRHSTERQKVVASETRQGPDHDGAIIGLKGSAVCLSFFPGFGIKRLI